MLPAGISSPLLLSIVPAEVSAVPVDVSFNSGVSSDLFISAVCVIYHSISELFFKTLFVINKIL